jgi:hypothetical protein
LEARSASVISEFLSSIFATSVFPLCVFAPQRDKFPFLFPDAEAGKDLPKDFLGSRIAHDLTDCTKGTPKFDGDEFGRFAGTEQGNGCLQSRGCALEAFLMAGIDGGTIRQ